MIVPSSVTKLKGFILPAHSQSQKRLRQGFAAKEEEVYLRKWPKPGDRDKLALKD